MAQFDTHRNGGKPATPFRLLEHLASTDLADVEQPPSLRAAPTRGAVHEKLIDEEP